MAKHDDDAIIFRLTKAKRIFASSIFGTIIIFAAYVIVSTAVSSVEGQPGSRVPDSVMKSTVAITTMMAIFMMTYSGFLALTARRPRDSDYEDVHPTKSARPALPLTVETMADFIARERALHDELQYRSFRQAQRLRWAAWTAALVSSIAVVLAADTAWAKTVSIAPIIATALLGLEAFEPFTAKSGWHYRYMTKLDELTLRLSRGDPPIEIAEAHVALEAEMGASYPHWRLPREART